MEKAKCASCYSALTTVRCGLCAEPTCKACAHFLDEDAFSFRPVVADHLKKGTYCNVCYQAQIAKELEAYNQTMAAARNVDMYFKTQGKETRLIKRETSHYSVKDCADRDELILRLAFLAVLDGYSTLVDTDVIGDKVRKGAYQTTIYRGTATAAIARANQIPKDRSLRSNPN